MMKLRKLDDVMWYLSYGHRRPELGRFSMEFMSLVHVPYDNRWTYFRGWEYWAVLRHIDLCETDVVLDAGSLRAFTPVWLARDARRVVCIDNRLWERISTSPGQYTFEEWTEELLKFGMGNIETHVMDMCGLLLRSLQFDLILSWSTLEHIEEDWKASKEMHRVLKTSGVFAGTVDWGRSEESKPNSRLYDNETFRERIVEPAGWEYIVEPPPKQPVQGHHSAMVFFLRKA